MPAIANKVDFICGYFKWLEIHNVRAAVLHGWEEGFRGKISDIDHVVDENAFPKIATIVHQYCQSQGWRMCQILRHEKTAAFCVCSAIDDPATSVALDACSDYLRCGKSLITSGDLLENRIPLTCGGFRLSDAMELRYRLVKAAAKDKTPDSIIPQLLDYPDDAYVALGYHLKSSYGVCLRGSGAPDLEQALASLAPKLSPSRRWIQMFDALRIIKRVLLPSGIVCVLPKGSICRDKDIIQAFASLYFRRHRIIHAASAAHFKDVVYSTLIVCNEITSSAMKVLPRDCVFVWEKNASAGETVNKIAEFLHYRCKKREHVVSAVNA